MADDSSREYEMKIQRLMGWHASEMPGPWEIVVFPTNRCNLRCGICWQRGIEESRGKLDHSQEVSDERLLAMVDEAAELGVREWSIAGGGEPMIRADLVMEMCARIRKRGMNGGIFTNGALLNRDHLAHLVDIGWMRLDYSLDGPTAEVNDAIRSEGSFERATESLRTLNAIKQETGATGPHVDLHCVLTRLNIDKMEEMVRFCQEFGITKLGFSVLQVQNTECKPFYPTDEQWDQLPEWADRAHALGQSLGIETSAWTVADSMARRDARQQSGASPENSFVEAGCFEPFLTMAVVAEGYVGPCCAFWDDRADRIQEKHLRDIWTGPWFQHLRERMIARDYLEFCRYCPSHFIWLTEERRTDLRAMIEANTGPRPLDVTMGKRLVANIRQYGLRGTGRRAWEWMALSAKARRDTR